MPHKYEKLKKIGWNIVFNYRKRKLLDKNIYTLFVFKILKIQEFKKKKTICICLLIRFVMDKYIVP